MTEPLPRFVVRQLERQVVQTRERADRLNRKADDLEATINRLKSPNQEESEEDAAAE